MKIKIDLSVQFFDANQRPLTNQISLPLSPQNQDSIDAVVGTREHNKVLALACRDVLPDVVEAFHVLPPELAAQVERIEVMAYGDTRFRVEFPAVKIVRELSGNDHPAQEPQTIQGSVPFAAQPLVPVGV